MDDTNCYHPNLNLRREFLWFPPISTNPAPLSLWCKPAGESTSVPQSDLKRRRPSSSTDSDPETQNNSSSDELLDLRLTDDVCRQEVEPSASVEFKSSSLLFVETEASPLNLGNQGCSSDSGLGGSSASRLSLHSASPSPQPRKKNNFYPLKSPDCLTAPYQSFPEADTPLYLYTWTLPSPKILADLASLDQRCFMSTDQCFGILFSKPLSENDYVCRLPLYLTRGMARARVHLVRPPIKLTQSQLDRIVACHRVLAELVTNIADLSHVGLQFANRRLRSVIDRKAGEAPGSKTLAIRDQFEELDFNPAESRMLGLITLICLPSYEIDFMAIDGLLHWSESRASWQTTPPGQPTQSVRPNRGIIREYPVRLSQIPAEYWSGIMVRPSHLPDCDPAMFAVSGPSSKIGLDPVPSKLSEKLLSTLNTTPTSSTNSPSALSCSALSYVDYFVIRHASIFRIMKSVDGTLPLVSCFRLTRHQNAAQVTAGLRKDKHAPEEKLTLYLADTCAVHPLSAWLWFLLSTIPLVLYQLSRALSAAQFSAELAQVLAQHRVCYPLAPLPFTVLMPDRVDAPKCMLSELSHFTAMDLEVNVQTPADCVLMDEAALCDPSRTNARHPSGRAPHPDLLLEATTLLAARDAVNLERLELLGDSLLQLLGTLAVYTVSPVNANEGYLTAKRIPLVSNASLFRLVIRFGWFKYCTAQVYSPPAHFVYPCYTVCKTATLPDGDSRLFVKLSDKSLADMMEALIGCFLLHLGLPDAIRLLDYFGISPYGNGATQVDMWSQLTLGTGDDGDIDDNDCASLASGLELNSLSLSEPSVRLPGTGSLASVLLQADQPRGIRPLESDSAMGFTMDLDAACEQLREELIGLQNILGYHFRDVTHLIQALVHVSSPYCALFGSYERLEFLGDAVLGYVITVYLYHKHTEFDPGKLTESRSDIVSNNSLASAVVEHKIHPYILHANPALETAVSCLTCIHDRTTSYSEQLELINQEVLKGLRLKILADVFESIIGAIFVDTKGNLSVVSNMIHRLMDDRIRDYLKVKPTNPLQSMHILHSDLKYTEVPPMCSEETGGKYRLCASVGGQQIYTYGTTRNEARLVLAQRLRIPMRHSVEPITQ